MNIPTALVISAALLAAGISSPAEQQDANARRLFYEANPGGNARGWAGIRTSMMLRADDAGGQPDVRETGENVTFKPGDRFRMRVQTNASGYLYLLLKSNNGEIKLLYPGDGDSETAHRVRRFETRTLPSSGWFKFDQDYGVDRIYAFLSPKPVKELERLAKAAGRSLKDRDLDRLLDRGGDHPALHSEEETGDGAAGATYYVEQVYWDREYLVRRFRFQSDRK